MLQSEEILEALEQVLSHESFASSPKSSAFLEFIVKETLKGNSDSINEISIAQDLYGKGAEYDTTDNSLVRVSARRVRNKLKLYYAEIDHTSVIITIPNGRYVPKFKRREAFGSNTQSESNIQPKLGADTQRPKFHSRTSALFLVACSILIIYLGFVFSQFLSGSHTIIADQIHASHASGEVIEDIHFASQYPRIAITPFSNQTKQTEYDFLEKALQWKIAEDLSRFQMVRPTVYQDSIETLLNEETSEYDYAIDSMILSVEPEIDIFVKLIELETKSVVFENRIKKSLSTFEYQQELMHTIVELGGRFVSELSQDRLDIISKQIQAGALSNENMRTFECAMLSRDTIAYPDPIAFREAYLCLEGLLKNDPDNAILLSSFGNLIMMGALAEEPVFEARKINPDINAQQGLVMMLKAVELLPFSAETHEALSSGYILLGDRKAGLKHAELAYYANPGSPNIILQLSRILAGEGEWDRSFNLMQMAVNLDPNLEIYYQRIAFLRALMESRDDEMERIAQDLTEDKYRYDYIYSFLASVANEDYNRRDDLYEMMVSSASREGNEKRIIDLVSQFGNYETQNRVRELFVRGGVMKPIKAASFQ
jgi:tetratricopeptide (TPR) repeat protein